MFEYETGTYLSCKDRPTSVLKDYISGLVHIQAERLNDESHH